MISKFLKPVDEEWRIFLDTVTHDFYHLASYSELESIKNNADAEAFYLEEEGKVFFVPYMIRSGVDGDELGLLDICSVYGYPGPLVNSMDKDFCSRAMRSWLDQLKKRGLCSIFLRFNPMIDCTLEVWNDFGEAVYHGETVYIDLTLSEADLWSETKKRHRYEINRLKRNETCSLTDSGEYYQEFIDIYYSTMKKVNASEAYFFDTDYFYKMKESLSGHLTLLSVIIDDKLASSAMFIQTGDIVQYHLSATSEEFIKSAPTKFLLHEASKYFKEKGAKSLHLGGGYGGEEDNLFKFKAGFSSSRASFYTWRSILDESKYLQTVKSVFKRKNVNDVIDLNRAGFFPKYRR